MNTFLYTFAIAALLGLPSAAIAGVGNGNGADKGNKNGWTSVDHHNDVTISVPKGLVVSGEKRPRRQWRGQRRRTPGASHAKSRWRRCFQRPGSQLRSPPCFVGVSDPARSGHPGPRRYRNDCFGGLLKVLIDTPSQDGCSPASRCVRLAPGGDTGFSTRYHPRRTIDPGAELIVIGHGDAPLGLQLAASELLLSLGARGSFHVIFRHQLSSVRCVP